LNFKEADVNTQPDAKLCDRCLHIHCEEGALCFGCKKLEERMRRAMEARPDTEDDGYPD